MGFNNRPVGIFYTYIFSVFNLFTATRSYRNVKKNLHYYLEEFGGDLGVVGILRTCYTVYTCTIHQNSLDCRGPA